MLVYNFIMKPTSERVRERQDFNEMKSQELRHVPRLSHLRTLLLFTVPTPYSHHHRRRLVLTAAVD
jgi:hypothetical protein